MGYTTVMLCYVLVACLLCICCVIWLYLEASLGLIGVTEVSDDICWLVAPSLGIRVDGLGGGVMTNFMHAW